MILNTSSEYAIKLVFYLIENNKTGSYVRIRSIADELEVSYYLLAKVAHALIQKKILSSYQGPRGGIRLMIPPGELTIMDIIRHFANEEDFNRCVLGLTECSSRNPCAIHFEWLQTKEPLLKLFSKPLTKLNGLKALRLRIPASSGNKEKN